MKANQKGSARGNDAAAVGVGTMIVFIATILVAAVAAAVLIDTSGLLQERSQQTGLEATREVSSNLFVKGITGSRNSTTADIDGLNVSITLAPGSPAVDIEQLVVEISDGSVLKRLTYDSGSAPTATKFVVTEVRDDDSSFTSTSPVLTAGDLVVIWVGTGWAELNMPLAPREVVSMTLVPEAGAQIRADFVTPASYGTNTVVKLR